MNGARHSQVKALLLSLWGLSIIWAAISFFHIVDLIGSRIARIIENRVIQVIMLAWIFTTFLQRITVFGVITLIWSEMA